MTNGKRKGKEGELEIARIFRSHGYIEAKRSQQFCGAEGDADIIGVPNLHIEVKRRKSLDIKSAIEQATNDSKPDTLPTVIYRADRKPWVAVLNWDVFDKIYRASDKLLKIIAKSNKAHNFYKWLEDNQDHVFDIAVVNISPSGHFVFMYLDSFIDMYRNSSYGG